MEQIREIKGLRAPQGDCQTLIDPPWPELPEIVTQNRLRMQSFKYDLHGRSIADLSTAARRRVIQLAIAYTSQYRSITPQWLRADFGVDTPLILSGHQPELFHPGVWYKNFVLGSLARRVHGLGLHLLIDSDICRAASIRVPAGSVDEPRVQTVCYDKPAEEVPYEERRILDDVAFSTFAKRAGAVVRPMVRDPMVEELWPLLLERGAGRTNLGQRLALGRHAFEETWQNETLELPQSEICQMPEFAWFVAHLLAHLPRFRTAHNNALSLYRKLHRMRNRAHPVPDLAEADGWLEAPFWIWTSEDPQRRPLFARQTRDAVVISDRAAHTVSLPLTAEGDLTVASQQLASLASQGIKLRTRALSTTLFARLVLGDLFLHGIGGAKYDQVTDQIIRKFCGIEPPEFAAVSATLRLPIHCDILSATAPGQWENRLRQLRFHPEHFVTCAGQQTNPEPCPMGQLIATKRRWIDTPKTPQNAHERHLAIARLNEELQPYLASLRDKIEQERRDAQQHKRSEAILRSREYSFCLYPRDHFDCLLAAPQL